MHRRAEVSQAANDRYLESPAAVEHKTPLGRLVQDLCHPVRWEGQRVRALNPLSAEDARVQLRKQSAAVTRRLRLLRAHGLIRKVSKTHRYVLSDKGRTAVAALLAARAADTSKLTEVAA